MIIMMMITMMLTVSSFTLLSETKKNDSFFSTLLRQHGCDVDKAFQATFNHSNPRVQSISAIDILKKDAGGFGAQLVLKLAPPTVSAVLVGARPVLKGDLAANWNYGCPGHETIQDIMKNAKSRFGNDVVTAGKLIRSEEVELSLPLSCNGNRVRLERLRAAAVTHWFKLTPFMDLLIRQRIEGLDLPPDFMAVHIRGGDKLVSEWSGPYGALGKPHLWARAISDAVNFERKHFTPALPDLVFLESDDCKLLREVATLLSTSSMEAIHQPCQVPKPVLYTQRGKSMNVTGHHQWLFNHHHSCTDIARYFTGLTIFRDATAVLLGTGGHHGVPLAPAARTSNTVLLIELLRMGRGKEPPGRDYHFNALRTPTSKVGEVIYPPLP